MKKHLTLILFLIGQALLCQNDIPAFEFGHELYDEFYYEFIEENVSFVDLTRDKLFQKRQDNKIKRITVKHLGRSLDSLYLQDTSFFYQMVMTDAFDHGYSYVEAFNFDDKGFTISKNRFPLTTHLNKKDSALLNQWRTSSSKVSDSLTVALYLKDTIRERKVYLQNIVYRIHSEAIITDTYDSTTKIYSSKLVGYNIVPTTYFFSKDNKISRIKCFARQNNYYDMTFRFQDQKSIIVNCRFRSFPFDSIKNLENKIIKNKLGQILTSTFYDTDKPDSFSCYSFTYDKHNNLSKVNRRTKAKDWFDYTEKLYQFNHTYQNGKLNKTVVHYNFKTVHNDIVYLYNNKGLISELDIGSYRILYNYHQD